MKSRPKILAFAGSARKDSINKKLIKVAASCAQSLDADVTLVDFADFPMPLYDGDLEEQDGIPPHAKKFKELMKSHQGFLIASPEYNSSISPLLKNVIDWASRQEEGEEPLIAFKDKVAALLSASPGSLGGLRGLVHLRSILGNIKVLVLPDQFALSQAYEAFDGAGKLGDERQLKTIKHVCSQLVSTVTRLSGTS